MCLNMYHVTFVNQSHQKLQSYAIIDYKHNKTILINVNNIDFVLVWLHLK